MKKQKMRKKKKESKLIRWVGIIAILILEGLIIGILIKHVPSLFYIFGVPFALSYIVIGITLLILYKLIIKNN